MGVYVSISGMTIDSGPGAIKRGMSKVVKEVLKDAVRFWHAKIRPRHFKAGAGRRYGARRRSHKYQQRKQQIRYHNLDNVWSGLFRRLSGKAIQPTGTSRRMSGRMEAPWYVRMTPMKRQGRALGRELLTTRPEEAEEIREFMDRRLPGGLAGIKAQQRVKV